MPAATHVWCRFHHPPGVTHWVPQHLTTDAEITTRKPAMQRVLQTRDTRTVRRRFARLQERAAAWGITPWVMGVSVKATATMADLLLPQEALA
ncbi:MAG: hypothetical protein HYZ81_10610 [Nitrospinae bacterium]|nr:hypothetical protein [Nitrospinota bacterium]